MNSIRGAIENTVSISLFNKGLAGKIFEEVRQNGAKLVMKNNAPECVLLSPDEYIRLLDEMNDAKLASLAVERMSRYDPGSVISQEAVDSEFGFTPDGIADAEALELE
ncbi:MAG: type II toxin-antitoxin system Phd/YefM family antitoxin [Oscillospiraceae bacterium]|nr:type II toxin-antitoxin system Phd/YefM family antitoxin [Oscillospiraceae bacterium]